MMHNTKKGLCVVITATWLSLFAMAPVATTAAAVTSLRGPNESSDVSTVVDVQSEVAASQQQPRRDLMNYAHNTHGNYIQHTGNTYYYPPLAHEPRRRPMHGGGGAGNKKQCRPQNVSGRYANCYSCYTSIGSRGGKIVPGCYQTVRLLLQKLQDHFTEIDHDAYLSMRGLAFIRSFVIFDGSYLILRSFLFILYRIQNQ